MNPDCVLLRKSHSIATVTLNSLTTLITQTADAAEGLMAFFQRREPEFKGR